ncbi:ABC transporter permease [Tsukamurella serpentis]
MTITRYRPPGFRAAGTAYDGLRALLARLGHMVSFAVTAIALIPHALRSYPKQTVRTVTDLTWGRGAVIVGGGTSLMMVVLGLAVGGTVAVQAFATLDLLGMGPLTGVIAALANTREFAPILAAAGFAVQAGCRMTAEIGAMRITEEIDALEALGLRAISFVVSTRIIAGVIAIVPVFLIAIIVSFFASSTIVALSQSDAAGTYEHYFRQFLTPSDLIASIGKVVVFLAAVILIHCYQGFFASGGPEGVGVASGRAVRASMVAIVVLDMLLTIAIWGVNSELVFRG